jgi:carbamoylphosphate synthase large subunit
MNRNNAGHVIDSVLPTMGGQTALNLYMEANELGFGKNIMWQYWVPIQKRLKN